MALTPKTGLNYPVGNDSASIDSWARTLSDDIERAMAREMQSGTVSITGTGTDDAYTDINFPFAFPSVPNVVATAVDDPNGYFVAAVGSVTTTGARIRIGIRDNGTFLSTKTVHWLAIGH